MTPSRTREVAEELALLFASSWDGKRRLADRIEAALHAAEERGRVAGLEQAATLADSYIRDADDGVPLNCLADATAERIRSLIGDAK